MDPIQAIIESAGYEVVAITTPNTVTYYHVNFNGDSQADVLERLPHMELVSGPPRDRADAILQKEGGSISVHKT